MNTSETMIQDYDDVLDARYGKEGTPERIKFEEEAYGQIFGRAHKPCAPFRLLLCLESTH